MNQYIMGVDLGQLSDWTAISIIQETETKTHRPTLHDVAAGAPGPARAERQYALRYLERPTMRTPYPEIVERIYGLVHKPSIERNVDLVVDATGVGRPVIDMMVARGLSPIPITIVAGHTVTPSADGGFHVPKKDIAGALQSMFGLRKIQVAPRLALVPEFLKEMERFSIKTTKAGNVTYEAWRENDHDDLVLSVGLAVWWALFSRGQVSSHNVLEKDERPYDPFDHVLTHDD